MIAQVRIENYKCFRRVTAPLAPLTVLIGENNSGKSTFLEALSRLLNARRFDASTSFAFQQRAGDAVVEVMSGSVPHQISGIALPVGGPPMRSKGVRDVPGSLPLSPVSVPSFLDSLLRRDRERFDQVVAAMRGAIPGLQDLQIEVPQPDSRSIVLRMEGGWEVPADTLSAGTRMMMFFIALAWHPQPPNLVLIEEPENGLHPGRLKEVMEILHDLTKKKHSPAEVQVVMSTHSPYLLDLVDPDIDQILVFRRESDGSCQAKPLDKDKIRVFLDDFGLGEVWTNEGEAGIT